MEAEASVTRVVFVSPEPTPYRAPLLDRVAARPGIELTVVYAARTVARRTWQVELHHEAVFLDGVTVPALGAAVRHDYPFTPGIFRALRRAAPGCVVVSGWSTFASQGAVAWCRARSVPYVLLVESHDAGPKSGWRRLVKDTVVPPIVRGAASWLVVGSLARDSVIRLGARADRVRIFANTIDVEAFARQAQVLAGRRTELRAALGLGPEEVAVVSVGRLASEKGMETLIRAVGRAGGRTTLILVGDGPERPRLERLRDELGIRASFTGDLPVDSVVEAYAAADVFALLSEHEPWGVVVNEASAFGLPLVLSDRVGAAADLLRDGENGVLVPAGDVEHAAAALTRLAQDPDLRRRMGAGSREIVRGFGYESSVDNLVAAVRETTDR